jgi:hypothetical protein
MAHQVSFGITQQIMALQVIRVRFLFLEGRSHTLATNAVDYTREFKFDIQQTFLQ